MKPPAVVAAMRTAFTEWPSALAASLESPAMRTTSPKRVLAKPQRSSSASATPSGNKALIDSAACTCGELLHAPSASDGICGACGWINGLPR